MFGKIHGHAPVLLMISDTSSAFVKFQTGKDVLLSLQWKIEIYMKTVSNFIFIVFSIIFQTIAAITIKYAAVNGSPADSAIPFLNPFYIISLFFLFLQAIVWQQALIRYPLSFAYPFMSLVNFLILFSSALLFNEGITVANIIGLILISMGIALLTRRSGDPV
jgi:multidrug transporter EmrE-like cation transporter